MGNLKTIHAVAQAFQRLNFDQVVRDSFEETKGSIVDFDRKNLRQGFKVDGTRIGFYASVPYAAKKFNQSSEAGFGYIDLYLSGSWSGGINVTVNSKSFTTFSVDSKALKLEADYSPLIYGLPNKYKPNYVQIIGPVIFKKIKQATGL